MNLDLNKFNIKNISFEHLGNLNFTYPSYYMPVYDNEKINLFNNLYLAMPMVWQKASLTSIMF